MQNEKVIVSETKSALNKSEIECFETRSHELINLSTHFFDPLDGSLVASTHFTKLVSFYG